MKFGAGVDFFFVLSGFIITWAHWHDIGRPEQLGRFARRRFQRIYPPYWCVLLPLSLGYFLMPGTGLPSQHDPVNFAFSFLLLPYPIPPVLGVAWTLVFEMAFYALFSLVILFGRPALFVLVGWGMLSVATHAAGANPSFPLSFVVDVHNIEFLLGIGTAAWLRTHPLPFGRTLAIGGALAFVAQMISHSAVLDDPLVGRLGYGISAAALIAGLAQLERTAGLRVPRLLRMPGAASYAIYLVHAPALSVSIQIVRRVAGPGLPIEAAFVVITLAAILAGMVFHFAVERPLIGWFGSKGVRRTAPPAPPHAARAEG